jgi:hypothetical protein
VRARVAGVMLLLTVAAARNAARLAGAVPLAAAGRLAAAAPLAVVAVALLAAPAHAPEVTAAELRDLAGRAAGDRAALADLRQVDAVDGAPVDVEAALRRASGADLEARLAQLAETVTVVGGGRDAQADARSVLSEERFQEDRVPGPFRRILDWIGDRLPNPSIDWLDDLLPGGRSVIWIVLGALLATLAVVTSRLFLTRRVRAGMSAARLQAAARDEDPRALDRRAEAAEEAGDLEAALRLRFRAGLLRLDERGAIDFRASLSTSEVRHTLDSDAFDALAATFDDVVYGGRTASPDDLAEARETWPRVLKEELNGLAV